MSESLAVARPADVSQRPAALDPRRRLQLALGVIWLLDGMLQFQPFMFGKGFSQMLAGTAPGNPAVIARPVLWSAAIVGHHPSLLNAIFAVLQIVLGLGIAWRPTVKPALAASVAWALAVWWLGEGLGGLLAGTSSPVNGAPGAVLLYALLAVLLWPADHDAPGRVPSGGDTSGRVPSGGDTSGRVPSGRDPAPFPAARAVGRRAALAAWLVVWLGLAALALLPATRAPNAISRMIASMAPGEPAWLAWLDTHGASALTRPGPAASVLLAAVLAAIALAPLTLARPPGSALAARPGRPPRLARAAILLALAVAAALWLAQGLGGIFTGSGTDPGTGPLLALLALAYWPAAQPPAVRPSAAQPPAVRPSAAQPPAVSPRGA